MSNIRGQRICNRVVLAFGALVVLVGMALPMEDMSLAQFITEKLLCAGMGWALWRRAMELDRKGEI